LWQVPAHEHFRALRDSDFAGSVHVGITGTPRNRAAAEVYIAKFWSWNYDLCASANAGFEQVTLNALRDYVHREDAAPYILYAHTKSAHVMSVENCRWREAMTQQLVRRWSDCVPLLEENDAVGLHWLTAQEFPGITANDTPFPFFGGNFLVGDNALPADAPEARHGRPARRGSLDRAGRPEGAGPQARVAVLC
jgi:hypothetical protein